MDGGGSDNIALAMLSMAETFRIQQPPKVKMAIKCARGALKLPNVSIHVAANIHLQLGKLLVLYTENYEAARDSLELAYTKMSEYGEYFLGYRLESLQLLCEVYVHGIVSQQNSLRICQLIRNELIYVQDTPSILSKLLFYYIEASCNTNNPMQALEGCDRGIFTYQKNGDIILELYFRITKALIYMRDHETYLSDVEHEKIKELLDKLNKNDPHWLNLKHYYECIQVVCLLNEGRTRSARILLRTLQMEVTRVNDQNFIQEGIRWMDPVPLTAFACLMTIATAAYQCSTDRILKYFALVVRHVNEYLTKTARVPCEYGIMRSIQRIRLIANEFAAQAQIMACKPGEALNNMKDMMVFSSKIGQTCLLHEEFGPIIQNLLGLYCIYLREHDLAEQHFKAALMIRPNLHKNAVIMVNTNLCILYLSQCRHADYYSVAENLVPNRVDNCTMVVRANVKFALAIHAFLLNKTSEFRGLSEDVLNVAKVEDVFRLHNLAIMVCSQCFPVGVDALHSCISWGSRGLDHMMLCWSNKTLAKVKKQNNENYQPEEQASLEARKIASKEAIWALHHDHASKNLVQWFGGDFREFCEPH